MLNFEYLLRYSLNSYTLKLKNDRMCKNSRTHEDFLKRYNSNECIFCFFAQRDDNSIIPLLNLPINFKKTEHKLYYGVIAPGKTIYADKKYALEFHPAENFDSYIIYDDKLECITDFEDVYTFENNKVNDDEIEMSRISECENIDNKKEVTEESGIDQLKIKKKFEQILSEYTHLGYDFNEKIDMSSRLFDDLNISDQNLRKEHSETKEIPEYAKKITKTKNTVSDIGSQNEMFEKQIKEKKNQKSEKSNLSDQTKKNSASQDAIKLERSEYSKDTFHTKIVDGGIDIRRFSYVIKDSDRILPLHELEFTFDINLELRSKRSNLCEKCERREANMFCVAEQAAFCEECDRKLHYDGFTRRHIRHYFATLGGSQKFFNCVLHPQTVVDYFCKECMVPLCTQCRLGGTHPATHNLVTYFEANEYAEILKNKDFDAQKKKNEKNLQALRSEITKFRSNIAEVRDILNKQYHQILTDLDIFTNKKYQIFNAKYLEFFKENQTISRTHHFVNTLDNSEIVKNYPTITNQQCITVKDEFKAKYRCIFLHGSLSLEKVHDGDTFRKNRSTILNKTKEFYAESSENRFDNKYQ